MPEPLPESSPTGQTKVIILAVVVLLVLLAIMISSFRHAKSQTGTVVLPGGVTYLGPNGQPATLTESVVSPPPSGKIPIPPEATWVEYKGKIYPYTFLNPNSLSLGVFPNDPNDSVTIFYPNTDSRTNIFFQIINLNLNGGKDWISKPKIEFAKNWWKAFAWKGVQSVTSFVNSQGLTGYRAKYLDLTGIVPYDHVFFEVPNHPELMIWISGGLFEQSVFDRLVDSVNWKP